MTLIPLDPEIVAADLRPPILADLARRARRRNRRRRVTGAAAVLATVAAAGVLGWPQGRHVAPVIPESPAETYVSPDLPGRPERHLYMVPLNRTAAVSVDRTGCRITVRLTIDSGRTWTRPGGPPPVENCADDMAIGYTIVGIRAYRFTIAGGTWFTADAGRTWTAPRAGDTVVEAFGSGPHGTSLECVYGCDRPRAVDPATGRLMVLRNGPPLRRLHSAIYADQSTIWAVGAGEPGTPMWASHTNDLGRTWSAPVDLPVSTEEINILASGPNRAYVYTLTAEGRDVYRTDDGGRSWTKLELPVTFFSGLAETSTGRLILIASTVSHPMAAWVSTDGGETFAAPVPLDLQSPFSSGSIGGLIMVSGEDKVLHVHDGTGWYEIQPPGW
jgi:photosystem II stability/assembly factor-like uncharacterized protein